MRLSVAPLSGRYLADLAEYYREVAACPHVERAYIGELFCGKRLVPLRAFEEAVSALEAAGKQAVFSTLALPAKEADFDAAARFVERVEAVEVNNLGFIPWLAENYPGKTLLAGPVLNLYNAADLEVVRDLGCSGVSLHVDLMPQTVLDLSAGGILPTEVFLHGRPALAFSWRCYSARFAARPAEACGHVCTEQDGLVMRNLEGEDGFLIDGPGVYPGQVISTIDLVRPYDDAGAEFGRLAPEPGEVAPIADIYAALLTGGIGLEDARSRLEQGARGPIHYGPVARRRLS